jgi:hypothetical protein
VYLCTVIVIVSKLYLTIEIQLYLTIVSLHDAYTWLLLTITIQRPACKERPLLSVGEGADTARC